MKLVDLVIVLGIELENENGVLNAEDSIKKIEIKPNKIITIDLRDKYGNEQTLTIKQ